MIMNIFPRLVRGAAIAGVALALASCELPVSASSPASSSHPIPPGYGEISLSLETERGLVSDRSAALCDTYEILALCADTTRCSAMTPGNWSPIRLPVGTYDLHVMAGIRRSVASNSVFFVGSGSVRTVAVEDGRRTSCSIAMKTAEFVLESGSGWEWGASALVRASGASGNPHFGMSIEGASTTRRPRLKSIELWNGYKEASLVSGTPDAWSSEWGAIVPEGLGAAKVQFVGASVVFRSGDEPWATLEGTTKYDWKWMNRADMVDAFPLASVSELTFEGKPPQTGVEIGLVWDR